MSYDLAVWEGNRPADDHDAETTFEALFTQYLEDDELPAPNPQIQAFADAVSQPWADVEDTEETPWAAGPPNNGSLGGPIAYLAMARSRSDEVMSYAVALATEMGLICFDPQRRRVCN